MARHPLEVVALGRGRRHHVEAILREPGYRDVTLDAAPGRAHLCQRHSADRARQCIRAQAVEESLRARSRDFVLGKARLVEHPDGRSNGSALLPDGGVPVPPMEGVLVLCRAFGGEPERALPRESGAEDRSLGEQSLIEWARLQRPPGRELFFWVVDGVFAFVHLAGACRHVVRRTGVGAEAARIQLPHVVPRLSLHDPLRGILPRAAAEDDSEDTEAGQDVKAGDTGHWPHQAAAIRRITIGSVDDALDPRILEGGHPSGGSLEHLLEPVEIGLQEAAVEVFGNSFERPWLRVALEGADEQSASLGSNVEGGVRVTKHRQPALDRAELVELLGDEIVMLEGHDRDIDPDHAADLLRPLAGGIDDDLSADLALRGLDEPALAGPLDRGHGRVAENLRPRGASARRERLGQAARIDVSVGREMGCADDAVQLDERE